MDYLVVGMLGKPHGLRGEIEVAVMTDFPERFASGSELIIIPPLPDASTVLVETSRPKKNKLVIKLKGIDTIEAAEKLKGRQLCIEQDEAAELAPDTFWQHDLMGMRVETVTGESLGTIVEIATGGAHDTYVVENGKRYLIPAVKEIVVSVDLSARIVVVNPPAGLLEL